MTLQSCGTGCLKAVVARHDWGPSDADAAWHRPLQGPPQGPSINALKQTLHPNLGTAQVNNSLQVVLSTELVLARPFYGYHAEDRLFVKIKLYNPSQVNRIATLLQVSCCTWVLPVPACLAAQCPEGQD